MTGSIKLRNHPDEMVRLACDRCGRAGQYRKENLLAQFGPDIALPDLRHEIARCERHRKPAMPAPFISSDWRGECPSRRRHHRRRHRHHHHRLPRNASAVPVSKW